MTKIMLVEDDNNLREIYQARLAAEGYEIVSSSDGEAALAMAAKERPDMIISDVMMPKISGFEMLDILRNTEGLKNVKVIMLTALGQAEDSARANALGADRYLVKSQVTLEDIVKAAHELLEDNAEAALAVPSVTGSVSQPVAEPPHEEAPAASISVVEPPAADPKPVTTIPVVEAPADPAAAQSAASLLPQSAGDDAAGDDTTASTTQPADDIPQQTAASEEATIKQQIESFVNDQPASTEESGSPAPDPVPSTPVQAQAPADSAQEPENTVGTAPVSPAVNTFSDAPGNAETTAAPLDVVEPKAEEMPAFAPPMISTVDSSGPAPANPPAPAETAPAAPVDQPANDDTLLATAAETLAASTAREPDPAPAAPDALPSATYETEQTKKKVIEPLSSTIKPDLNQLLAVEEAKSAAQQASTATTNSPAAQPNVNAYISSPIVSAPAETAVDPNSISL